METNDIAPPAYSEQEFDQKISRATDISLLATSPRIDEEGWEEYDPAAFGGVSSVSSNLVRSNIADPPTCSESSSQRIGFFDHQQPEYDKFKFPAIVPLRIEKKVQSQSNVGPSECKASVVSSHTKTSCKGERNPGLASTIPMTVLGKYDQEINMYGNETAPSYSSASLPGTSNEGRLPVVGSSINSEPPRQDPWLADGHHSVHHDSYHQHTQSYLHESLSTEPRYQVMHAHMPQERPLSSYSHRSETFHAIPAPRVEFNSSVAYGQSTSAMWKVPVPPSPQANVHYDPHSFYNSAVSAQMIPFHSQGDVYRGPSHNSYPRQRPGIYGHELRPSSHMFVADNPRQSVWQPASISNVSISNSPRNATPDMNQFSQYPNNAARNSMYRS